MSDFQQLAIEIEKFKSEIRLPNFQPPKDIQEVIQVCSDRQAINNMSPIHLQEMAVVLSSYALYLTYQENRILSYTNWCEANIKGIVGRELQNSSAYSFNEKDLSIRSNNEYCVELNGVKLENETKLLLIKNLSYKIMALSERIENLAKEKKFLNRD